MEQEFFFADDQEPRLAENENDVDPDDVHIEINASDDIPFENFAIFDHVKANLKKTFFFQNPPVILKI